MLSNLLVSFNIVAPLFFYGLVGYILKACGAVSEGIATDINKIYFCVLVPCTLFLSVYNSAWGDFDLRLYAYILAALLILAAVLLVIVPRLVPDGRDASVSLHAILRGNTAVYGIPLAQGVLGTSDIGNIAFTLCLSILVSNAIAPVIFAKCCHKKTSAGKILKQIVTNPLLIGEAVGILFLLLKLRLPQFLLTTVTGLSAATTPIAFIGLGAAFSLQTSASRRKLVTSVTLARLLLVPLLVIGVGVAVFGFSGTALVALLAIFATPTAVCTFAVAEIYGGNARLAGDYVLSTTAASILTLFIWIFAIKTLGLA
ncbi:MAG: AEC family transporter [Oscillospiraceae bacterium]|nr:AEC family transporter [Oscillospiraceae bacterium]